MKKQFINLMKLHRDVFMASPVDSRSKTDFFVDKIRQASTASDMMAYLNRLMELMQVEIRKMKSRHFESVAANVTDTSGCLKWIRQNATVAAMFAIVKDDIIESAAQGIRLPIDDDSDDTAFERSPFEITMQVTCTTPLVHGADTKAGNATLFRRMSVMGRRGGILSLPYYSGNALRGQVRDLLADHFLKTLNIGRGRLALWFFYALYAGGALVESGGTVPLDKVIGANGQCNASGLTRLRDMVVPLSVLGAALGNRILPGRCQFGDLRPLCKEWGGGEKRVSELMTWSYLTRREDNESHRENHSMIASAECLKAGTLLSGGVDFDGHASELERSCISLGLELLMKRGRIGGESRRDMGGCVIKTNGTADSQIYSDYVSTSKDAIREFLAEIGAYNEHSAADLLGNTK